ncbi:Outer membrane protein OmpA [Kushneria avicenniae]|uniref:Outer membrane protein OmpA n=1 Tax=Kushneria avicenniae TaxID=402385 RepID=A0A1I1LD27_9GAMM|nr:OmpA family protein [Kushneria avicenniae]SFC71037.1 Outer membrane protein OmpA [Kushneria avicenniae]
MSKRLISLSLMPALLLSGCASMQDTMSTMSDYAGRTIGATVGAGVGYLACQDKNDVQKAACMAAGAGAGWAIGSWVDQRRKALEEVAQANDLAVVYQQIDTQKTSSQQAERGLSATINDQAMFASGSASLTPEANNKLRQVAGAYTGTQQKVLIIGHTDATGSGTLNQRLSEQRAKTVARLFQQTGLDAGQIYYQGAGLSRPVASNETPEGRALNRRVQIVEIPSEQALAQYSNSSQRSLDNLSYSTLSQDNVEKRTRNIGAASSTPAASSPDPHRSPSKRSGASGERRTAPPETSSEPAAPSVSASTYKGLALGGQRIDQADLELYNRFQLKDNRSLLKRLSPVASARASDQAERLQHACYMDEFRPSGDIHSLGSGKAISHSASDYLQGLNGSVLVTKMQDSLVGVGPVAVLKDYSPASEPQVYVYYDAANQKRADLRMKTHVNVYEGADTLLYRAFMVDEKAPVQCMDIVFDKTGGERAQDGRLFYQGESGLMAATYQPARPQR